jgi:hypothetical protein
MFIKVKHHHLISSGAANSCNALVNSHQTIGATLRANRSQRMTAKGHNHSPTPFAMRQLHNVSNQRTMPKMYAVKHSNGCHRL